MPIQQICTVLEIKQLNPFAVALTLEAGPLAMAARPGQFIHIKCGHSRLLRRPISICQVEDSALTIAFECRGDGTGWLSRRKKGDKLDILGPLGHGFTVTGDKLLLVGGGIGVPPLLYAARCCTGQAHAILGFRSAERAMLLDAFHAACQTVSIASDDGTLGFHGFVNTLVAEKLEQDKSFTDVLACGPKPMLRAVAQVTRQYGIPCQVSMEERMGCGVGACLVCACQTTDGAYRHVCKDGPVFLAEEVDWDA